MHTHKHTLPADERRTAEGAGRLRQINSFLYLSLSLSLSFIFFLFHLLPPPGQFLFLRERKAPPLPLLLLRLPLIAPTKCGRSSSRIIGLVVFLLGFNQKTRQEGGASSLKTSMLGPVRPLQLKKSSSL